MAALCLSALTSCSTVSYKDVKNLKIEGTTFKSFYLYEFEGADVSSCTVYDDYYYYGDEPTVTGYIYSYEKLSVGAEIKVWSQYSFRHYDENVGDYVVENGTTAYVKSVVESYPVTLIRSDNAYNITVFSLEDITEGQDTSVTDISDIAPAKKHRVEVVTDNPVYIEFYS